MDEDTWKSPVWIASFSAAALIGTRPLSVSRGMRAGVYDEPSCQG
jgi:hypothetical protein